MSYNGHKSYNYWNVALWIANDEGLYRMAKDCIRRTHNRLGAAQVMVRELNEIGVSKTPDGASYTVDSVRRALVGL